MYTIIDLMRQIRGTENLVFCMGFEDDEDCKEALQRLQTCESEISHRNNVPLKITRIKVDTDNMPSMAALITGFAENLKW